MYGAPFPSMAVTKYAAQLKEGLEKAYQQIRHKMGCSLKTSITRKYMEIHSMRKIMSGYTLQLHRKDTLRNFPYLGNDRTVF